MANPSGSSLSRANAAANTNQNGTKVGDTKQSCPIFDVLVLVAGTVDPVNSDPFKFANSYPDGAKPGKDKALAAIQKEEARMNAGAEAEREKYDKKAHDPRFPKDSSKDYYWGGDEGFSKSIVDFQTEYDHVHVFQDFGWSGDNCVENREIAGQVLGDWLCGYKMTPALPSYLLPAPRKVSFHFIGHSHGGNVINEVTKEIAKNTWPNLWKVKSVTYLSTPFFQKIHIPSTAKFSGQARICNTFNNYDLTQTAIADFSLRQLTRVTNVVVAAESTLMPIIERIVKFDPKLLDAVTDARPKANVSWWGIIPTGASPTYSMDPTAGHNLYVGVVALLGDVKQAIDEVRSMVRELNREVYIRISEVFAKKGLVTKRKILSDGITARINALLDSLTKAADATQQKFQARIATGTYPVLGLSPDLNGLLNTLYTQLDVNPGNLGGNVTTLIYDAFKEQIEVFDDTLQTCDHLYKGWPIENVDITSKDKFYKRRDPQFYKFKARLVKTEASYMSSPSAYGFLDLLLQLAAQMEMIRKLEPFAEKWLPRLQKFVSVWTFFDKKSDFSLQIQHINDLLSHWLEVFKSRDVGGLEVGPAPGETAEQQKIDRDPAVGSIPYLAMVSHSLSHTQLFPQVDTFLRAQFDSHVVKAQR